MSKARNPLARRFTAGLGIAALATAALFGSMLPASAADAGNINPDAAKSLTIHKFVQPTVKGDAPDGNELPAADTSELTALEGVEFTIQKVTNIDLATNAGWAATVGLTPASVDAGNLGTPRAGKTNAAGVLTFDGLDQAVYLVTETGPGENNIAFAAQPFLVTLPLPNESDSTWIYDVHVYPKNSLASVTKTVDDSAATGLGSDVTWNIGAKVPNASEGNGLKSFAITDKLDSRLKYKSETVTLSAGTVVTAAADYTIDTSTVPGTVSYTFTDAGLAKLTPGDTVNVALVTTVVSLGAESGIITNEATVFINDKNFTSDPAQTTWGNLVIHKVAANDTSKSLQGAEFEIYTNEADAKAGNNPVSVSGETTFTSGNEGKVAIAGLRATVNGTATSIDYWLVETKAPTGYNISASVSKATPMKFTVKDGKVSTTVDIEVLNPQTPPFTLPLTGGPGTVAFMIVGLGLLSIAGGVAIRKRSTRRVSQA
ncbi:SpaH/EbpB family LPXTG-anchored major pilin [Specibacter sp. AOP5-B1-6]|uniref:SpaH/EbpB family LPXTG-anchored major pilin n=1 Tax=Specibacter sp. AOP5-B1-6 TaxID=3457653 RepID=UPI00402BCB36